MATNKVDSNAGASDVSWWDRTVARLETAQSRAGRAIDRFMAGTGGEIILATLYVAAAPLGIKCGGDDGGAADGATDCAPAESDDERQSVVQVPAQCATVESAFHLVKNDGTGTIEFTENYVAAETIAPAFSVAFASADGVIATVLPRVNSGGDTNVSPLVSVVSEEGDNPLSVTFDGVNFNGLSLSSAVFSENASLTFNDVLVSGVVNGVVSEDTNDASVLTLDRVRFNNVAGTALSVEGGSASIGYVAVSESGTTPGQSLISISDDTDVEVTGGISIRDSRTEGAPLVSLSTPSTIASLIVYDSETSSAPLVEFTVGTAADYGYLANGLLFNNVYGDDCALTLNGNGNLRVENSVFSHLLNPSASENLLCLNPQEGGSVVVKNSIFDGNWDVTGELISGLEPEDYSSGAVTYNDFYNNEGEDSAQLDPSNLSDDPDYENTADPDCEPYDFLLSEDSPLIDAGVTSDRDDDGTRVDIGAFAGAGEADLTAFAAWVCEND